MTVNHLTSAAAHVFKQYGYTESDFADSGAATQSNVVRIHSSSDSETHKEFETLKELRQSGWSVEYEWTQRLSDGTILFEGHPPEVSQ
jgi:hypothetical protein